MSSPRRPHALVHLNEPETIHRLSAALSQLTIPFELGPLPLSPPERPTLLFTDAPPEQWAALSHAPRVALLALLPESAHAERNAALAAGAVDVISPALHAHALADALTRASLQLQRNQTHSELNVQREEALSRLSALREAAAAERHSLELALREAKRSAEEAERAKSAFLANMSHELRTPLNAILGYAELLQEELSEGDQVGLLPDVRRIHGAGAHLLALISDVLDLARIEAGRLEVYAERVDVPRLLAEIHREGQPLATRLNNQLLLGEAPDISIITDATKLRQIVRRLLDNAAKFTEAGTITLSAAVAGPELQLQVTDTGIGISTEQQQRIFQEFSQVDPSTTRRYGGTGLGLAIAQRMSTLIGAKIEVHSELGQGARFSVHIPLDLVASEPKHKVEPTPSIVGTQPATVLVIDADAQLRHSLSEALTRAGYRVISAASGAEGLHLARTDRPHVIALDVALPDADGWQVLATLKQDEALSNVPVVLVTLANDRARGLALGASDYLPKPIRRDALLRVMERLQPPRTAGPILVVEDDEPTRDVTRRMLQAEGYRVEAAENGRVALDWLANHRPSLILLDLMMPEVDGFHVVTELQLRDDWREIPVVVFTAMDVPPARLQFLERHVSSVIEKGGYGQARMIEEVRALVDACLRVETP